MEAKKMKRFALIGFLGGLQFAIGDVLVSLLPNYQNRSLIYEDWANMNIWRLVMSLYLGCLGTVLLLVGFYSLYKIVVTTTSLKFKSLLLLTAFGIVLTSIGHFLIACIVPMSYKIAILAGASSELAKVISSSWELYVAPLKLFIMIVVILIQSLVMIILIMSKKIKCPKWMILLNPIGLILLSIPITLLLNGTEYVGLTEAFESLGEASVYITVYYHWKHIELKNKV